VDTAYQLNDQDLIYVGHWILKHEGLLIGSSTALNIGTILKSLPLFPEGSTLVSVCCDQGSRHISRFWNPHYLRDQNLKYPENDEEVETEFHLLWKSQPNF
jgi:cysteine synthase A